MKKIVVVLLLSVLNLPGIPVKAEETHKAGKWLISAFAIGAGAGILANEAAKEREDAAYADRALDSSYMPSFMMMDEEAKEGYQGHWKGELNKHDYRQGVYNGASYVLATVAFGCFIKGMAEVYLGHRAKVLEKVEIKPSHDFSGGILSLNWRFK